MEFKSLKNIETSFRQLRLFGIVYLCVCTLLVFFFRMEGLHFCGSATGEDLCSG